MAGPEIPFTKPVRILLVRTCRDRVVSTVEEAAKVLLNQWPSSNPYAREFANWVFAKAVRGECTASYARSVFVCAAQQAGIYLGSYEEPAHSDNVYGTAPRTNLPVAPIDALRA